MITQAQIEAVLSDFTDELTAQQRRYIIDQICRITAAARVGERYDIEHIARTAAVITKAKQDTIERCAQVAETFPSGMDKVKAVIARDIAAAIRKLKDAP